MALGVLLLPETRARELAAIDAENDAVTPR
jgi:hypothetical protein